MPDLTRDSHCSSCGTAYPPGAGWPRRCRDCGGAAYRNPLPVAVAMLPVTGGRGTGLVVIRRTIEPARGLLALPGGFIDHGEDWREAVVRELREETGIAAGATDVRLVDVLSSPDHLVVFGLLPERRADALPPSVPLEETEGWEILDGPAELGFPLHTLGARAWFSGRYRY